MYRGRRRRRHSALDSRGDNGAQVAARTALLAASAMVALGACSPGSAPATPDGGADGLPAVTGLARGNDMLVEFTTDAAGEVVVETAASATGASWGWLGSESAIVSLFVDDQYVRDLVIASELPTPRAVAAGELAAGEH
nr:hypothetical protein [Micromonospora sp. DSM 115978]